MAFFCSVTGVRIAGPGVSKSIDPEKGHAEVLEVDGVEHEVKAKKEKPSAEKSAADKPSADADKK